MRYPVYLLIASLALVTLSCKRDDARPAGDAGFLAGASTEAKEALSEPAAYQLTEENFAKWEVAERNLDRIPASDFSAAKSTGGSAIDRAVARLESSPRARSAIEATGLTVRDFVLETVALAQAVEASQTGRSTLTSGVASENFAFVERYRDRIRRAGLEADLARQSGDSEVTDPQTAAELAAARADSISRATDSAGGVLNERSSGRRDSLRDSLNDSLSATPLR